MPTTQQYDFKTTSIYRYTDGDTFWLYLDLGIRALGLAEIRLDGFDTPEMHPKRAKYEALKLPAARIDELIAQEQAVAEKAKAATDDFLEKAFTEATLWVHTEKDPEKYGRWLGTVWREETDGTKTLLGDVLKAADLATVWPTRWFEAHL